MSLDFDLPKRNLRGFLISRNPAEPYIRDLGFDLPKIPVVKRNRWNNYVRSLKEGPYITRLSKQYNIGEEGNFARFDYAFKAIFAGPDIDLMVLGHETGHGLNASLNPIYSSGLYDLLMVPLAKKFTGLELTEFPGVEKGFTAVCTDEGLATWLAYKLITANAHRLSQSDSAVCMRSLGSEYPANIDLKDSQAMEKRLERAREAILEYQLALYQSDEKAFEQGMYAIKLLQSVQYGIGYFFAANAINRICRSGVDHVQAYTKLIQNPPTKIEGLKTPNKFADLLLAR